MAKQNKKLVATSILSVALCGALLASSSFAWFTDKVVNEDNSIASGTLEMEVVVGDIESMENGNYETGDDIWFLGDEDNDLSSSKPLIDNQNWEPGQSDAKFIQIKNDGTLALDALVQFTVKDSVDTEVNLQDVIWFKLYKAPVVGSSTGDVVAEGRFDDITDYLSDSIQLLPWDGKDTTGDGEIKDIDKYTEATTAIFILEYGMDKEAGNIYQGLTNGFSMDLSILAKQSTYEEDGFDSDQYDKDAEYDAIPADAVVVSPTITETNPETGNVTTRDITAADLKAIVEADLDGYYVLSNDIDLNNEKMAMIGGTTDVFTGTFDGNGYTISNVKFSNCAMFGELAGATIKNLTLENVTATANGVGNTGLLASKANTQYEDTTISNVTVDGAYLNSSSVAAFMIASSQGTYNVDRYQGTLIMDNIHIKDTVFRAYNGVSLFVYAYENGPQVKITNSTVDNVYLDPGSENSDVDTTSVDLKKLALYSKNEIYNYDVDNVTLTSIYNAYSVKSIFNDGTLGGEDHTGKVSYGLGKITMTFEEYKALVNDNIMPQT